MRRAPVALCLLVLCSGCAPDRPPAQTLPPVQTGLPSAAASPTPASTRTPSQEELVKQAQAAYRVAFDEFERLSREGGASEPSARMKEVETGLYLEQDMALLRDQKKRGYRVEGKPAVAKSRPAPGKAKGDADPRLTLQICEDRRGSKVVEPGKPAEPGLLWEGLAYARVDRGGVVLVDVDTDEVSKCPW